MKKLSTLPVHKIIIWACLVPSLLFILVYEFVLTNFPSPSVNVFKAGQFFSRICYSIAAASIFYLISQYLGIFVPKQRRKFKILPFIFQNALTIDSVIRKLEINLGYEWGDIKDSKKFKDAISRINTDNPVSHFNNWYEYLSYVKFQLLDLIRGITFYNEHLNTEFLHELLIIEQRLMSPITFVGYKILAVSDLSYAEIDLQELIIHNAHLQTLRERESEKYKNEFEKDGELYRQTYYNGTSGK